METAGEDAGSDSESEDENMAEGEISLQELNRHVSSEEQYVFWPRTPQGESNPGYTVSWARLRDRPIAIQHARHPAAHLREHWAQIYESLADWPS